MNNMSVQSAIPDFTMTSAQERELSIPTTAEIPSSFEMMSNQSVVTPTVKVEETSDYGTVKIVPPMQNNNDTFSFNNSSSFAFTNAGVVKNQPSGGGLPMTDTGMPLVNLIG